MPSKKIIDSAFLKLDGRYGETICKASPDGRFILKKSLQDSNLVLTGKGKQFKIVYNSGVFAEFSDDSRELYYTRNDSLFSLQLFNSSLKFLDQVQARSVRSWHTKRGMWLAYKNGKDLDLVLVNQKNSKRYAFKKASIVTQTNDKNMLLINDQNHHLTLFDCRTLVPKQLNEDIPIDNPTFDVSGDQLAFIAISNSALKRLSYYQKGIKKTLPLPDSINRLISQSAYQNLAFNRSGDILVIQVGFQSKDTYTNKINGATLKIWSYRDFRNPVGEEGADQMHYYEYSFAVDLKSHDVITICGPDMYCDVPKSFDGHLLLSDQYNENYWNNDLASWYAVDLHSGLKDKLIGYNSGRPYLSAGAKYAVWFDTGSLGWLTYNLQTKVRKNICYKIPFELVDDYQVQARPQHYKMIPFGLAGWAPSDESVYIYDQYDIWKVDPNGLRAPVCITHQKGRKAGIILSITKVDYQASESRIIRSASNLLLSANNEIKKDNGLWLLGSDGTLQEGKMIPYYLGSPRYSRSVDGTRDGRHSQVIPVGDAGSYLVELQSAESYPNWYLTKDLVNYQSVTDSEPQKNYNWLTSELVNYELPDGTKTQGILYKPENFNASQKYPVIFQCYQGQSNRFHAYWPAKYSGDELNIPYYVSNGYLVFQPDIYWQKDKHAQAIVAAVLAARSELVKRSYVDSTRLGIQGHSFGGYDVNMVVAHSGKAFAAACESAGLSDITSNYNELRSSNVGGNQIYIEYASQFPNYGLGKTPWADPVLYIKDSPVYFADKVNTPLLMLHGDKDDAVPFHQGMEFFLALRRAGKKAWLLEYPRAGHGNDGADAKDFTIRMKQFFDHYLMGAPAPQWMNNPVDAARQQKKVDYELDTSGMEP